MAAVRQQTSSIMGAAGNEHDRHDSGADSGCEREERERE